MKRVAWLVFACATAATAGGPSTMHWRIGGVDRQALVFRPSIASVHPPLLVFFHGHGGNARAAAQRIHFQDEWPEAIVVYPQGLPTASPIDPGGRLPGWQREAGENADRDLRLFDAIVRSFPENRGVFAAGFSNGAFFSYLLWAQRASALRGLGICAAALTVSPSAAVAVIHIAGRTDPLVQITDQARSMAEERRIDGCTASGRPCGPGCEFFSSSTRTPEAVVVHPGGHVFPPWAAHRMVAFFRTLPAR